MLGQSIRLTHGAPGAVVECEIKLGQVQRPPSLPSVQLLRYVEVLKGFVVHPDLELMWGTFKEVPPLLQCLDNGQHLLVMDLIVPLNWAETLGEESNRMPFPTVLQ